MPGPRNARRRKRTQHQKEKRQTQAAKPLEVVTPVPPPSILDTNVGPKHAETRSRDVAYKPLPSKPLRYAYTVLSTSLPEKTTPYHASDASKLLEVDVVEEQAARELASQDAPQQGMCASDRSQTL